MQRESGVKSSLIESEGLRARAVAFSTQMHIVRICVKPQSPNDLPAASILQLLADWLTYPVFMHGMVSVIKL